MNKKYIVLPLLAPFVSSNIASAKGSDKHSDTKKPNVIIIYADDLGYGDLQCYGAKNVSTPNADRLAKSGIKFTNSHAVAATSTPSRYSLLTGEYAWRKKGTDVAAGDAAMIIKPEQYTLADMFRQAGYKTSAIGKWHLGLGTKSGEQDWNSRLDCSLDSLGFDYHYIMAATADRVPCVFIENGCVENYDSQHPIYVSYSSNFDGEPTARANPELLYNLKSSHGHDMAIINGIGRIGYMKGGGRALWKDEDIADKITDKAVNFIKANKDEPFFMYFATNDVHVPRFPHQRFRGASSMGLRGDAIAQFDYSVGKIMSTLEEQGLLENTLIILSSDNGAVIDDGYDDKAEELLNGHRVSGELRGNKYSAFEGGTIVPTIISWKGKIKPSQTSDALMSQIDWFASLAELIGVELPQDAAPDSRTHLKTLIGQKHYDKDYVVSLSSNRTLSIRSKKWKYIEPSNGAKMIQWGPKIETGNDRQDQLYNLRKDRSEQTNVAHKHHKQLKKLKAELKKIIGNTKR